MIALGKHRAQPIKIASLHANSNLEHLWSAKSLLFFKCFVLMKYSKIGAACSECYKYKLEKL